MVRHLVGSGRRRIAVIAGPDNNFDAHERLRGYRDALAEALPEAKPWVLPGAFDEASGHSAGRSLLESPQRPDAVFAANDMMALGCLFAFNQAGLRVPDDVALAGFDDIPLARYVHPALTTMRVDIASLGGRALRALLARTNSTTAQPAEPLLLPELIVRASTVPTRSVPRDSS
jgi:LacI family transcriptional regulator